MPLFKSKSKQAFSKNVATEMDAGKPQKQALAIAYSTKRKARKMNKGGEVTRIEADSDNPELDDAFDEMDNQTGEVETEDDMDPQNEVLTEDSESPWQDEEPTNKRPDVSEIVKRVRKMRMQR